MDKTPKYIEMSEKATKIQAPWKPQDGDWFAIKKDLIAQSEHYALKDEVYQVAYTAHGFIHFMKYTRGGPNPRIRTVHLDYLHEPEQFKLTWLPTQSQLQNTLVEKKGLRRIGDTPIPISEMSISRAS